MNISKEKREKLIKYLEKLKEGKEDEDIRIISEIEKALNEKKYGLVWEEHEEELDKQLVHNIPVFKEIEDKKIVWDNTNDFNFLLEGDNLHSLKLLEKTHKGKVDVIYIDPPYNTGNKDFIYDDNYIGSDDGYRHSKWISFMDERLKIAKELLSDEGVIFISIDDNEYAQLKLLCDGIFEENNFLGTYIKQSKVGGGNDSKFIVKEHEYCLCYAKNIISTKPMYIKHSDEYLKRYKEEDSNGRFFWDTFARPGLKNPIIYDIIAPDGTIINNGWIRSKERFEREYSEGKIKIVKKKDDKWSVQFKQYLNKNGKTPRSMTMDFGGTTEGDKELKNIFGKKVFNYPKSIKYLTTLISTIDNKNATILDYFAGSGTTGHAVVQLNKEDGGNRKYILCTNNENNICEDVTYKRLSNIQEELPHNLKYYKVDYVSKSDEEVYEKLNEHIQEMVNLEEGKEVKVIYAEEEVEKVLEESACDSSVYIVGGIMLSGKEQKIVEKKRIKIKEVPEIYYRNELKELGEI